MSITRQWVSNYLCYGVGVSNVHLTWQGCLMCASWGTEVSNMCPTGKLVSIESARGQGYLFCLTGQGCLFCASWGTGVSMCLTWQWLSILCPTGQGCLLCASWGIGGSSTFRTGQRVSVGCVRGQQVSSMCVRQQGLLLSACQGRGIYCVPDRTVVFIVCHLRHMLSNMCLTWQWVSIMSSTWHRYPLCASQDSAVYGMHPGTQSI